MKNCTPSSRPSMDKYWVHPIGYERRVLGGGGGAHQCLTNDVPIVLGGGTSLSQMTSHSIVHHH